MKITDEDINLLSQGLVESRVSPGNTSGKKTYPGENWEPAYCVFCQKQDGWVTMESAEFVKLNHVARVCDECYEELGVPPMKEVPPEFIHHRK